VDNHGPTIVETQTNSLYLIGILLLIIRMQIGLSLVLVVNIMAKR
jgi:hypothetical protein